MTALGRALANGAAVSQQIADIVVARIELDARMTVREYRQWQERGCADPLSAECQELYRLQKVVAAAGPTNGDGSFRIAVPYVGV